MITFKINNNKFKFKGDPDTPLLWVIRDEKKLTGTKFGCGMGQCGACTIHVDGKAQRSCITPVSSVNNKNITTIEGLAENGDLTPVQQAWIEMDVPQCGYCQAGQIMAATDFLKSYPKPTDEDIKQHMTNICRCGTYVRIRKAIHRAAELSTAKLIEIEGR
jgi:isoquinoline 1-oxidoreductase alpha subunit